MTHLGEPIERGDKAMVSEYEILTRGMCEDLGYHGTISIFKERMKGPWHWHQLGPALWFNVEINDPPIRFKVGYNREKQVLVVDMNRQASEIYLDLRHPMSLNKYKSFLRSCKEKASN